MLNREHAAIIIRVLTRGAIIAGSVARIVGIVQQLGRERHRLEEELAAMPSGEQQQLEAALAAIAGLLLAMAVSMATRPGEPPAAPDRRFFRGL